MSVDPFELLYSDAKSQGIRLLEEGYEREPYKYDISLGIGYLFAHQYEKAWSHFHTLIEVDIEAGRPTVSIHYGMAGVAKWCLDEGEYAVEIWRDGLGAGFADGAGGVKLPLLLFAVHALNPSEFPNLDAESKRALSAKARSRRIETWPGALAEYVLGRIDELALRQKCLDETFGETRSHLWLADFYVGLMAQVRGDSGTWANAVRKTSDTSLPEWTNHDFFLSAIWNEEFFLARHEAAKLSPNR